MKALNPRPTHPVAWAVAEAAAAILNIGRARALLLALAAPLLAGLPLPASAAKQTFRCTVLFAPMPGHPAHPSGTLSVMAENAADAACAASGNVEGCRATCTPQAAAPSSTLACVPGRDDPPGQRCLAYICAPKDAAWGSGADYRVTARTPGELRDARRRPGDPATQGYKCMGEDEYTPQQRANRWPQPAAGR